MSKLVDRTCVASGVVAHAARLPTKVWAALLLVASTALVQAQDKPNVVIMLADNVGYGDIGAYGAGEVRGMPAPRIDSIAAQGVSVHDWFPTLPGLIGAKLPDDRPIDGVDQGAFLLGRQAHSNRESLITFMGEEIAAVRWREFRLYPKAFVMSDNPIHTRTTP